MKLLEGCQEINKLKCEKLTSEKKIQLNLSFQQNPIHSLPIMNRIDRVHLIFGTGIEHFDFRVPFLHINDAHHRVHPVRLRFSDPDIDAVAIGRGGIFQIAVIHGINKTRIPRVC